MPASILGPKARDYTSIYEQTMQNLHDEKLAPALVLVKCKNPESRITLVGELEKLDHIASCEAIEGDFDLIMSIEALPGVGLERLIDMKIKTLPFVDRVEVCRVDTIVENDGNEKSQSQGCESFLFVEVADTEFRGVFQAISLLSAMTSCQVAEPPCSLVVRLRGTSFDFLNKVINEKVRCLPGVLRARQYPVIKLADL